MEPARRREGADAKQTSGRKRRVCPFSERPTTAKREPCLPCHHRHPSIHDGMDRRRTAHEGDWAALRTRAALLLDRRPGHHTITKTAPLMWWKGIMQGLRLTPAHPQTGPGAVGQAVGSAAVASAQFRHHETASFDKPRIERSRGVLGWMSNSADGVWFLAGDDSSDRCWRQPTGHRILGMA